MADRARWLERARALDPSAEAEATGVGRAMTLEQALADALSDAPEQAVTKPAGSTGVTDRQPS